MGLRFTHNFDSPLGLSRWEYDWIATDSGKAESATIGPVPMER